MATKKKASAKKGGAKKSAARKTSASKATLTFPLTAAKVAAINRCLARGTLKVTISKVDLGRGRVGESWLYD